MPKLHLDEIPSKPTNLPLTVETSSGLTVLRHDVATGGIVYLNLYFALDDLTAEQLTLLSFITNLLGVLETKQHTPNELQNMTRSTCGTLYFNVEPYGVAGQPKQCRTFLTGTYSALESNVENATKLAIELLRETVFQDKEKVLQVLRQCCTILKNQVVMSGHKFAMGRVQASCTAAGAVSQHVSGIAFLQWLQELEQNFEQRFSALSTEMAELLEKISTTSRLTVSVTGTMEDASAKTTALLAAQLPQGSFTMPSCPVVQPWGRRREGITVPANVSFAVMGALCDGVGTNGKMRVLGKVVSLDYLWNAIRVQGGAYGAGMVQSDDGLAAFYSYRDPNAAHSLNCYQATSDFLAKFTTQGVDLTGFIIGAVSDSDPLLTPKSIGHTADSRYWKQISYEDCCRIRKELLSTTAEDLATLAQSLKQVESESSVCVIGSQQQLDACGDILETSFTL